MSQPFQGSQDGPDERKGWSQQDEPEEEWLHDRLEWSQQAQTEINTKLKAIQALSIVTRNILVNIQNLNFCKIVLCSTMFFFIILLIEFLILKLS